MRKLKLTLFFIIGFPALYGCTNAGLFIANMPSTFFDGTLVDEIIYDETVEQKLDIYVPASTSDRRYPVIVFFHGGRWTEGKKDDYAFVGTKLASEGFVVVIPDYRKFPEVKFPTFVEDSARSVEWVHRNIGTYGGRADAIFLAGHSSGAHMASLLVSDERYLNPGAWSAIRGFAGLAGPYAFTPQANDLKEIFGPPAQYPQIRATTFIDGGEAPMLLLYGDHDKSVAPFNHERLRQEIERSGGSVEVRVYRDLNHIEIIGALSWVWRHKAPVLKDLVEFFESLSPSEEETSQQNLQNSTPR